MTCENDLTCAQITELPVTHQQLILTDFRIYVEHHL